ncbi:hypothetical protein Bca4012_065900 [Brassica carinata]
MEGVKWIQCPVKKMREVVCHVLDHLREEGPQTATRRLETLKVLRLLGMEISRNRFLSLDFRFEDRMHLSPRIFNPTLLQQVGNLTP